MPIASIESCDKKSAAETGHKRKNSGSLSFMVGPNSHSVKKAQVFPK
jgi:hypothetical protein